MQERNQHGHLRMQRNIRNLLHGYLFYKLDREYDGIMKVLDERHKLAEQANA